MKVAKDKGLLAEKFWDERRCIQCKEPQLRPGKCSHCGWDGEEEFGVEIRFWRYCCMKKGCGNASKDGIIVVYWSRAEGIKVPEFVPCPQEKCSGVLQRSDVWLDPMDPVVQEVAWEINPRLGLMVVIGESKEGWPKLLRDRFEYLVSKGSSKKFSEVFLRGFYKLDQA